MEFINPFGRKAGNGVQPRACMCADDFTYTGYRGNYDSCGNCGCGCDSEGAYRTGNRVAAMRTFRAS